MDKFTGKIGYVMYSENRTQNGIRPDMRNRLWRAISLWKEGHLEKILITGDMVANIHKDGTSEKNLFLCYMKKSFSHRKFLNRERLQDRIVF